MIKDKNYKKNSQTVYPFHGLKLPETGIFRLIKSNNITMQTILSKPDRAGLYSLSLLIITATMARRSGEIHIVLIPHLCDRTPPTPAPRAKTRMIPK